MSGDRPLSLPQHVRRTLALAVPVMLARAGLIVMVTVGTVMSGQAGAHELAFFGISLAPHTTMIVIGTGLLIAPAVLAAQACGAGRFELCGRIWRMGLILAAALGLAYAVMLLWSEPLLLALGQAPEVAAGGARVLLLFAPGMPAILLFVATSAFLEGIGRPVPGMLVSLGANLLNWALCWVFIFGHLGSPAMGAAGAALAASITRWAMIAALAGYVLTMRDGARYGVRAPLAGHYGIIGRLLRIGVPLAVAAGLETSAFAGTAIIAGWLGEAALAGFQVALNVCSFIFMLTMGVSTATGVRVANAIGRRDRPGMARAGWIGAAMVAVIMVAVALLMGAGRGAIASAYSGDSAVQAVARAALAVVACMIVFDGLQGVLMGAARGAADVIVPTVMHAFSFWAVAIPLGYHLAIPAGYGVPGLFLGLFVGLVVASLLLGARFHVLAGRNIRPT